MQPSRLMPREEHPIIHPEERRYTGGCHCGRIRFAFSARATELTECNCSICRAKGALWLPIRAEALEVIARADDVQVYRFGTCTAEHSFCRACGIHPYVKPRILPQLRMVNAHCVDDPAVETLPRRAFDGRDFERAAEALMAEIASRRRAAG